MSADIDLRDTQTVDRGRCGCVLSWRSPEVHDRVLRFEDDGLAGAMRLWDDFDVVEDDAFDDDEEGLSWVDFPDFVAAHNWARPREVADFARRVDDYFRRHHRR